MSESIWYQIKSLYKIHLNNKQRTSLVLLLIAHILLLEFFSPDTAFISNLLIGCSTVLAFVVLIINRRNFRSGWKNYILLTIVTIILSAFAYLLGTRLSFFIPLLANSYSYFIMLIDLGILLILVPNTVVNSIDNKKYSPLSNILVYIFLAVLVAFSASNNFSNLGDQAFHQDERYSISVAKGLNETGKLELWDFFNKETTGTYTRNSIYTDILSLSGKVWGFNEVGMRIPTAIAGTLGVLTTYLLVLTITQSKRLGILGAFFWTFNDVVIYFSRFARGYIFLMILVEILVYLLYRVYKAQSLRREMFNWFLVILVTGIAFTFHQTTLLVLPFAGLVLIVKHWNFAIKNRILISTIVSLLLIVGSIFLVRSGLYNQLDICITCVPQIVYFSHLLQPYHLISPLLFTYITFSILVKNKFANRFANILLISTLLSLLCAIFIFSRYEDFRYVAVLQPFAIISVIFITDSLVRILKPNPTLYTILILLFGILFMKVQIPNLTSDTFLTQTAQANWQGVEGSRIHRRAARPDEKKAFDWIFNDSNNIAVIRLQDGGINWDDGYYLAQYVSSHPDKSFTLYGKSFGDNLDQCNNIFTTGYTTVNDYENIPLVNFDTLKQRYSTVYFVSNISNLTPSYFYKLLDKNCQNISDQIGIYQYIYLQTEVSNITPYFPNVYKCSLEQWDL